MVKEFVNFDVQQTVGLIRKFLLACKYFCTAVPCNRGSVLQKQ